MISLSGAVAVIITLLVAGLIFWLLWWLISYCGIPEPFNKVARVVIGVLLQFVGGRSVFVP